jgi:TatD DNase family protein
VIDSHCHLADRIFADDLEAVIARARTAGVERALVILAGGDTEEAARAQRILTVWPDVRVSIGVHPHQAHQFADNPERSADLVKRQWSAMPVARAIGEIGLDYHYAYSPPDVQRAVFRVQLRLAAELKRPIVIHTREADDDTLAILREEGDGRPRGVLHCFTGDSRLANAGLDLGLYISVAGIITFPKASGLREVVHDIPLDRLLTETDSPFLAPVPYRGKRNEPAHVARVVGALADLHGLAPEEIASRTRENFHALFEP